MSCLGVHFAITEAEARKLLRSKNDDDLVDFVQEEIEEASEDEHVFQSDKAWDSLHRCLSDGTLNVGGGRPPLNKCFFGGRVLNKKADYFVVLLTPAEVGEVAGALPSVTRDALREKYFALDPDEYDGEIGEEDWEYTWSSFQGLPEFFARAAKNGRHVIFTVDQ